MSQERLVEQECHRCGVRGPRMSRHVSEKFSASGPGLKLVYWLCEPRCSDERGVVMGSAGYYARGL